ncbi:hypothetical protein HZ326_27404 [Fusarium oxysporum f. sp. albedinis]|nr:hypothetical protein HZ326_27404 [Fusarium oxysporum f. sp. albedinis]
MLLSMSAFHRSIPAKEAFLEILFSDSNVHSMEAKTILASINASLILTQARGRKGNGHLVQSVIMWIPGGPRSGWTGIIENFNLKKLMFLLSGSIVGSSVCIWGLKRNLSPGGPIILVIEGVYC